MKYKSYLTILISLFFSLNSFAKETKFATPALEEANFNGYVVKRETAVSFLKEKSQCYLAAGRSAYKGHFDWYVPSVLCVIDGTYKQGTVDEKSGCALMVLNMKTARLEGLYKYAHGVPLLYSIASKPCLDGGIDELLQMIPTGNLMKNGETNAMYLYRGGVSSMLTDKKTMLELLYSENDSLKNIFDDIHLNKGKTSLKYVPQSASKTKAESTTENRKDSLLKKVKSLFN